METVRRKLDTKEDLDILHWLTPVESPLNYGPQQTDNFRRRQPGTGKWLLDSVEYQDWLKNDRKKLFCPGIPGAGKTIITSIVVDDLNTKLGDDPTTGIAYIYCNFRQQREQKVEDLLASLLEQLAGSQHPLSGSVKALYGRHRTKRTRPSFDELAITLHSVTATYSRVFIIIDALDECQTFDGCRTKLLSELFKLHTRHGANIFATSRFIPEIINQFKTSVSLEIRATTDDVARYLESHIERLPSFVHQNRQLQEEIKIGISEAIDGMYVLIGR